MLPFQLTERLIYRFEIVPKALGIKQSAISRMMVEVMMW
jgi:hypothetical protein